MSAPVNDLCANALTISSLPYTDTQDVTDATDSAGDPTNTANGGAVAVHNVWYAWTAPSNMDMIADLNGSQHASGSGGSAQGISVLVNGVFTGSCGGAWTEIGSAKRSNFSGQSPARIKFSAVSGTTYYFNPGSHSGNVGIHGTANLKFNLYADPGTPTHDLCTNAITVGTLPWTDAARDCVDATQSMDDPSENIYWGDLLDQSVWYKLVAPSSGTLAVDSNGSDFVPILAVWSTGSCGSLGGELAADQNTSGGGYTTIGCSVTSGQTYYIEVGAADFPSSTLGMGKLTLNVSITGSTPPPDPPTGLTAVSVPSTDGVNLSWTAPASGTTPDDYEVQRCHGVGCTSWSTIGTTSGTSFNGGTYLDALTTYRYQVRSRTASFGDSSYTSPVSVVIDEPVAPPCYGLVGTFRNDFGGCIGEAGTWGSASLMGRANQGVLSSPAHVTQDGSVGSLSDDSSIPALATIVWLYASAWMSYQRQFDGIHSAGAASPVQVTFNGDVWAPESAAGPNQGSPAILVPVCSSSDTDVSDVVPTTQGDYANVGYPALSFTVLNASPDAQGSDPQPSSVPNPYAVPYFLNNPLTGSPWTRDEVFAISLGWIVGWDAIFGSGPSQDYISPDIQVDRLVVAVRWRLPCPVVSSTEQLPPIVDSCGSMSSMATVQLNGTTFTSDVVITVVASDGTRQTATIISVTPTKIVFTYATPICGDYWFYVTTPAGTTLAHRSIHSPSSPTTPGTALTNTNPCCSSPPQGASLKTPAVKNPDGVGVWTPECDGAGDVPTASDLTDSETWD